MRTPSLRRHQGSGQGIVTLDGHDFYLGAWPARCRKPPPDVQGNYDRLIAEWLTNGRRLPHDTGQDLTITMLVNAFWPTVEQRYRHADGTATTEVWEYKLALRALNSLYGSTPARDFGPLALKAVRGLLVNGYVHLKHGPQRGLARGPINKRVSRIRRLFKWAASEQMLPITVYQQLMAVEGLRRNGGEARETKPVQPVARAVVDDTLPHLLPMVADMVRLQLETGMRPGELVIMRACDIDVTGAVWLFRPFAHKTEHHGHSRVVPIGPKGQEIVRRWLRTQTEAFLFSPALARAEQNAERRKERKTPLWPSHLKAQKKKRAKNPRKRPGERYTVTSYARAVARSIEKGNIARACQDCQPKPAADWCEPCRNQSVPHWHPHQLRHTRALELKREAGLDAARAVLGHRSPVITEHYATLDMAKAAEVMARIG